MKKQTIVKGYEPKPTSGAKSFYGKCRVYETEEGYSYLQSYTTIVAFVDPGGVAHRVWEGYSATTMRHLAVFGLFFKKDWEALPIEELPKGHPFSVTKTVTA